MAAATKSIWQSMPWFDASGRVSPLKLGVLAVCCAPAIWMADEFASGRWDFPSPYVNLIYHSGLWCTYLLLASLAITPLRRLTGWGRLAQLRRLLGIASFSYCLLHILAWFGLRFWNWAEIGTELLGRATLWVATASFLLMLALAATSFDRIIRSMGRSWKKLHTLVYAAAFLAVLHFLMSPGSLQGAPFLMAGIYLWLMIWRWLERRQLGASPTALMATGLASAIFAMLLQPVWLVTFQAERNTQSFVEAILGNFNAEIWIYLGVPPMWLLLGWTLASVTIAYARRPRTLPKPIS